MSLAPPEPEAILPPLKAAEAWPAFLLGWGLGALLVFGSRALGQALLGPCEGRTLLALLPPLLLGPGGLLFTSFQRRSARRTALGLGLVVASLLPALAVGAADIGKLRTEGCAGGYLVLSEPGRKSVNRVQIREGGARTLSGRIGGYQVQGRPGPFTLRATSSNPLITVRVMPPQVRAGEVFSLSIEAAPKTPINLYTVRVSAQQSTPGISGAETALEVSVRP